jgi:hypothetical protein
MKKSANPGLENQASDFIFASEAASRGYNRSQ